MGLTPPDPRSLSSVLNWICWPPPRTKFLGTPLQTADAWRRRFVSPTHRPPLPPGNIPGADFCQRLSRHQGYGAAETIMSMKSSNDTIRIRTRDLPACCAVVCSQNHTKHTNTLRAECRILESQNWRYIQTPLGFKSVLFVLRSYPIVLHSVHKLTYAVTHNINIQQGLVLRPGDVLEYLVVNRIVVKRVLFKWFKLR